MGAAGARPPPRALYLPPLETRARGVSDVRVVTSDPDPEPDMHRLLKRLALREFNYHHCRLHDRVLSDPSPFRTHLRGLPWAQARSVGLGAPDKDAAALAAWQEGRTGYPLVDAALRCLVATGCVRLLVLCVWVAIFANVCPCFFGEAKRNCYFTLGILVLPVSPCYSGGFPTDFGACWPISGPST